MTAFRETADGLTVSVRATPRASRDAIDGTGEVGEGREALFVRVRAAPADGAANTAIAKVLAKAFGCAKRDVTLVAGASARLKRFELRGDPAALSATAAAFPRADR